MASMLCMYRKTICLSFVVAFEMHSIWWHGHHSVDGVSWPLSMLCLKWQCLMISARAAINVMPMLWIRITVVVILIVQLLAKCLC